MSENVGRTKSERSQSSTGESSKWSIEWGESLEMCGSESNIEHISVTWFIIQGQFPGALLCGRLNTSGRPYNPGKGDAKEGRFAVLRSSQHVLAVELGGVTETTELKDDSLVVVTGGTLLGVLTVDGEPASVPVACGLGDVGEAQTREVLRHVPKLLGSVPARQSVVLYHTDSVLCIVRKYLVLCNYIS